MKKIVLIFIFLSALWANGQSDSIYYSCKAFFKHEVNTQIMTLLPATAINFYDKSEGNVTEWYWDFGDGNTSNDQNPMFIFNHPVFGENSKGKLNPYRKVSLTVKTSDGCKSYYSEEIKIFDTQTDDEYSKCEARFKYYLLSFDSLSKIATYQFNNYSTGENLDWVWQFDDGTISTEFEPVFKFDLSSPERKVCLTVSNDSGCSDIFCDAVFVKDPGYWEWPIDTTPYPNCFVEFGYKINYDVKTFAPALVLNFHPKIYGNVEKILWDFGDGTTSNELFPMHIYNLDLTPEGSGKDVVKYRTACVSITTTDGCESSYCLDIPLYQDDKPEESQCHAWFKYYSPDDVVTIPEVKPYRFYDASDGEVIERKWIFEDGSTSKEKEVHKTFNIFKPTQKVCLTINTANGCMNTWCETIFVSGYVDSTVFDDPNEDSKYKLHITGEYPIWASACIGKAIAQLFTPEGELKDVQYYWSNGNEGNVATNLCPTRSYTVTAIAPNGDKISRSFKFNSDGSITGMEANWRINEIGAKTTVYYDTKDSTYRVEWKLCDGTIYLGNNVPVDLLLCGDKQANITVLDNAGNIVKSETFELSMFVGNELVSKSETIRFYPNPVVNELFVEINASNLSNSWIVLYDITGKVHNKQELMQIGRKDVFRVDTSALPKGIFFARVVSNQKTIYTHKFIK